MTSPDHQHAAARPARRAVLGGAGAALASAVAACSGSSSDRSTPTRGRTVPGMRTIPLPPDPGSVVANPDRGLTVAQESHYARAHDDGLWPLDTTDWAAVRARGDTLVFRYYYVERHLDGSPFAPEWLDAVRADLVHARESGLKMIPRLAYRRGRDPVVTGRPFHDSPPVDAVLRHVDQLAGVLDEHAEAVLAVEQGSYGLWGETCFTDHFATGYDERNVSDRNWADRFRVLDHWLAGTARSRLPVLVRLPALRDRYVAARPQSPHLDRVGIHNDGLDASDDDLGTFSLLATRSVEESRRAVRTIADRLPYGGECASGQVRSQQVPDALAALRDARVTFLLGSGGLPRSWQANLDAFRKGLGYRLVATAVRVPTAPRPGSPCRIEIDVRNDGCAPPVTERRAVVELTRGRSVVRGRCTPGPRSLTPGATTTLRTAVTLPDTHDHGEWHIALHLPDPAPALHGDPRFAIRLVNAPKWDEKTGRNHLTTLSAPSPQVAS